MRFEGTKEVGWPRSGQPRTLKEVVGPVVKLRLDPAGGAAHVDRPAVGLPVESSENPEFGAAINHSGKTAVVRRIDLGDRHVGMGFRDREERP